MEHQHQTRHRYTHVQTHAHTDRHTYRQTHRQTDRQTHTHTHRDTRTHTWSKRPMLNSGSSSHRRACIVCLSSKTATGCLWSAQQRNKWHQRMKRMRRELSAYHAKLESNDTHTTHTHTRHTHTQKKKVQPEVKLHGAMAAVGGNGCLRQSAKQSKNKHAVRSETVIRCTETGLCLCLKLRMDLYIRGCCGCDCPSLRVEKRPLALKCVCTMHASKQMVNGNTQEHTHTQAKGSKARGLTGCC